MASTQSLAPYGTVRLFPLAPNWEKGITDQLDFRSEIITSRNGKEQRIAYREVPRRSRSFALLESEADFRTFLAHLSAWQGGVYVLPDLVRDVLVTVGLGGGTGDDTITVDGAAEWLIAGEPVVLSYAGVYGLYIIDSVDTAGTGVTFTTAELEVWPAGTKVHPGLVGYLDDSISSRGLTNEAVSAALRFDVIPLSEPALTVDVASVSFNDREVFLRKPNWRQTPRFVGIWPNETVDYQQGGIARFNPMDFAVRTSQWTYTSLTRTAAAEIEHFFRRNYGQQKEFYLPTWENNLPPALALASASLELEVEGTEVYDAYNGSTIYTALAVILNDGTHYYRLVDTITSVGGNSIVTVTATWGANIALADINMISWMPICRLASDGLVTKWFTDTVAEMQITQRTLETVALETGDLI